MGVDVLARRQRQRWHVGSQGNRSRRAGTSYRVVARLRSSQRGACASAGLRRGAKGVDHAGDGGVVAVGHGQGLDVSAEVSARSRRRRAARRGRGRPGAGPPRLRGRPGRSCVRRRSRCCDSGCGVRSRRQRRLARGQGSPAVPSRVEIHEASSKSVSGTGPLGAVSFPGGHSPSPPELSAVGHQQPYGLGEQRRTHAAGRPALRDQVVAEHDDDVEVALEQPGEQLARLAVLEPHLHVAEFATEPARARGISTSLAVGKEPSPSRPRVPAAISRTASCSVASAPSVSIARSLSRCASAVGCTPWAPRSNSTSPVSASSALICCETAEPV